MSKIFFILIWGLVSIAYSQSKPLKTYQNCQYQKTDWADGDSFQVKPPDTEAFTVRLYGADCMEWHITDTTMGRRLRHQRNYFGISQVDPDPNKASEIAKSYGAKAAEVVQKLLSQPFTVHTAEADARGDSNFKRYYAFVVTADGKDLSEELVRLGLARAFGVNRETYHVPPRSAKENAAVLADLELQAAMKKQGIWAITDWQELPIQRQQQREDEARDLIGLDRATDKIDGKIDPNTAAYKELMALPGIGEKSAGDIIKNRPYTKADDLLRVPGIGRKTLEKIAVHLEFQQ